jgi:HK97 family phage portal protein
MNLSFSIGSRTFSLDASKSAVSPDMAAWMRAEDVDQSSEGAKLTSPYSQSAWVYIAVTRLAEKVSQIPFRISRVSGGQSRRVRALRSSAAGQHRRFISRAVGEDILESGPAVDLFNCPHPTMNRALFWEMMVTWLALRGEAFVLPLDNADQPVDMTDRAPKVSRLLTLPTELFWHIVTGYELAAWRYTGSPLLTPIPSEILQPGEVIHLRMPNPYLYWRGMSPLLVAMVAAGADYAASQYAKGYWLNNADTGVIVTTDQQVDPEQRAAILAALRERKRKAGTADRPLFLWGGAKVEKPTLNGMESQFIENRKMNRQEIGAIFKVPESVMGFSDAKSSALSGGASAINAEQIQFIESTICPLCTRLEEALAPVVASFGDDLVGWFDYDSLPAMQAARRERLDSATKAFALGAAFNDINALYDLGFPDYPWHKTGYLPFGLQPAGLVEEMPGEEDPEETEDPFEKMARLLTQSRRGAEAQSKASDTTRLWQQHILTRQKTVKLFKSKTDKVLFEFRSIALAKLETAPRSAPVTRSLVDLIFDAAQFGAKLNTVLQQPIQSTLNTAGKELRQEIGVDDPWTMPPQDALQYVADRRQPILNVGGTVRDQINTALNAGLDAGETTAELAARVKETFNRLSNGGEEMSVPESLRVARTEVNMAYGHSRQLSMKDAGIEFKSWLSSHGPNVREGHAEAEDTYQDAPIPIDEPFMVPNKDGIPEPMMFPGDDSLGASAGNIINCQCISLAAMKTEEDSKGVTYHIHGLGPRTFPR